MTAVTATTINRTPFREMKDIPLALSTNAQLQWETCGGKEAVFTSDGMRFAVLTENKLGCWWTAGGITGIPLRPLGMTWETAEALVASPPSQPAPQAKVEEPLPLLTHRPRLADVETAAKAIKASQLPKDGDTITVASAIAIAKEGCRQALDEAATRRRPGKSGNFSHVTYINPWPPRTFIIASPPGRRKYVKLLLKRLGYRNVDKIPTTDKQTPFDLGRSLPDHERENLLAIAPGIVLRDVL